MDHDETLEALELAATEPAGLDRLMAGDTPHAAAVVSHLTGCAACADELQRLQRVAPLLRDVVRTTPPADLRERTLAFVQERGVARGPDTAAAGAVPTQRDAGPVTRPSDTPMTDATPDVRLERRARPAVLPWVAMLAAAVVISVAATSALVGGRIDQQLADQQRAIAGLEAVTSATLEMSSGTDTERVALAAADGSAATGTLLYSPTTTRLVVVARGLAAPPTGKEYRCWVDMGGTRAAVGKMFFADELAYWVGDTPEVAASDGGLTFGVSLVEIGGDAIDSEPVIVGAS